MDFEKYKPLMIIVEVETWGLEQEGNRERIGELLEENGYELLVSNFTNHIYYRR